MGLKVVPLNLKEANDFVAAYHRHNKPVVCHRFSIGAEVDGVLVAVAIVGNPVARLLADRTTVEVLRVCAKPPGHKNACSFLYGACWRVWREMGGTRILTYTLATESGASMRAVGWKRAAKVHPKHNRWATRPGRDEQPVYKVLKYRWEQCATHLK